MNVSIIIVNYKVKEKLLKCVDSIKKYTKNVSYEIIVVDNEGDKSLQDKLKKISGASYIKSESNLGFGGANNLGALSARGDYLFFLNPDTFFIEDIVSGLYRFISKDKKIGVVAPMLLDISKKEYELQGTRILTPLRALLTLSFLSKFIGKFYKGYYIKTWDKKGLREVDVCPGTAFMISRRLFNQIGGFDEKFFLYFEEFDLCKRIKKLNYKNYIISTLKLVHEWGMSTVKFEKKDQVFAQSRAYYFRKHYGTLSSLVIEIFLHLNKYALLLLLVFGLSLFLRLYNLSSGMTFIGDQSWFYLSAREMLMTGKIPLVGITSSHTWLHQGPLWTYILSVALKLSNYSPLSGAYLTVIAGSFTCVLIYILGSKMFTKRIGIIASFLYAVSPLVIFFDRMPYHTTLIPLFTLLYFFSLYKWITGNIKYFPITLMLLAILYNFELATFSLVLPVILVFILGFLKKKKWVIRLFNKQIMFLSVILPALVMLPIITYDFSHGFKQTIVFLGWTLYKPFSFLIKSSGANIFSTFPTVINFIATNLQRLILGQSLITSLSIFFLSIIVVINKDRANYFISKVLLLFLLLISLGGIVLSQSPSDAYLPIIFPFVIFLIALFFDRLLKIKYLKYLALLLLLGIIFANAYFSFNQDKTSSDLGKRILIINKIIVLSGGREYNLIGEGNGSQFTSFTMNYEYLLWWKGHAPSHRKVDLKFIVSETPKGFVVVENND